MSVEVIRNIKAEKELDSLFEEAEVDSGYFGGTEGDGQSIASIAAQNEASRPFMSRAADKAEKEAPKFFQAEAKKPNYKAGKFFAKLGLKMVALIKKEIDTSPSWAIPNSPATIIWKGSSHPLVDTAVMKNNTDFRVNKK